MQKALWVCALVLVGCGVSGVAPAATRTLPETVVFSEMPEDITHEAIPPSEDWVVPAEDVTVQPGDVRSGVLLSGARAARAARLRIAYDELRQLYLIDLRTWSRERAVYERYLEISAEETATWRIRAQRDWWETNGDEVSLFLGLGLGIVLSVATGAIIADIAP